MAGRALEKQQRALGRLLVARELSPAPDALRLALSGKDPADIARMLYYIALASRAEAHLIQSVRANVAELGRLRSEAQERAARLEIGRASCRERV